MSQFIEMFGNPVTNTKGWKTAKIKDVAPEMPSKEQLSGKIWLLNLDMIESNTGRIIEKVYEDVENALSVQSFDEGNVLFSKLRPYLNKVVIPDEPGMATTELVPLRPEPSKLHKVFLSHMLRGNQFVNYANDIAGGTKMPRMPLTELRNFDCILPPMDKQLEFVFIAEQADKSKFGDFKSQFIEMFGDPMTNTKAWVEFGYIGNYTQIVLGTTPNSKNSSYWNGEIKWITPAEMTEESYYIYDTERHLTEEGLKAANLTLLPCRSVLFSTRAPIGKVGLVGSPMYCNQGFKNFVCGDQLNPVYLYYSLIFKREYLVSLGTGTTFKELSKKAVENLKIAVPPLILQNKFEEIYQQADKSKFGDFKSQFIEMFGNPFEINSEVVPLSSLCSINPSKPKGLDDSLSVSFIPMDRISEDGEYAEFETKPLKDVKKGFTYCAEDDVLFAKITPCMENGKGAILKGLSNGIGFGSTEFHVLRPILGISNSEWLYFLTKLNGFRIDAAKNMTGTGGQKRVPSSYLLNFKVLKPQLEVQREFAKIVHQADKSKFELKQCIEHIDKVIKSLING